MTKEEISYALKTDAQCLYNGKPYKLLAFYLYADKKTKELKYAPILLDKCGHSTITVRLEDAVLVEKED